MSIPLRVLILEDNPSDAELVLHALRRAGYDPIAHRVETEMDYAARLEPPPEIILADFSMPGFDSLRALEILQQRHLDIPFIIVSGTIGEERAVQVMQHGATDYVIKDRLTRLGPAVEQALARGQLKEAKIKAEQTVARLAAIVETSGEAIIAATLDGIITSWNHAAEVLYGYTAAEIIGQPIAILTPLGRRQADAPENPEEQMQRLCQGDYIAAFETVRVRQDRRRIEVLLSISPIRDTNGTVIGASTIALDITQRKRSDRFLSAEQSVTSILTAAKNLEQAGPRVLQTMAECLRWEVAVLWTIDKAAGVLRRANFWSATWAEPNFIAALNHRTVLESGDGVAGRTWSTGEPVWERGIVIESVPVQHTVRTGEGLRGGFGLPMRHGLEMVGVIEFYNPELREPDKALIATLENIAAQISQFCERRRTEAALHVSEERFRQLADAMPQIVWTARADGHIDYFNERWYEFTGCKRDADPDLTWRDVLQPDDVKWIESLWGQSVRSGAVLEQELCLIEKKTGQPRWFLSRAIAATDAAGNITRWHGTLTDIDDQRRSHEALRISEARFRNLVMALPAAVYTTDIEGYITLFNEHAAAIWGRRPEPGKDRWCGSVKLLRPDGTQLAIDEYPMALAVRTGRVVAGEEFMIERPDGSRLNVLKHPELLRGANGEIVGAVNMVIDITQMKLLEEQYRQSQKMEAVGQLAAGVAHDFNNLLTIILGYTEIFLTRLPPTDPGRGPIVQIRKAGERAAGLTRQLLAFGRKQVLAPVVLDLNALLTELEKMLRRLFGADIEMIVSLQADLGRVKIDPGQVEQIVINLVVNARDAMPTGGQLTIRTFDTFLTETQSRQHADLPPGAYVVLSVTDTGIGMSSATKARVFEPFFTTKEIGKGTGLGLATVFGIIKQSGGFIQLDSELNAGTTFRIYLPQVSEAIQLDNTNHRLVKMPRGGETVLLVEDEENVRELAQMALEASGYKVLSAWNGDEAIQVCQEFTGVIHLLFTDVVMPKMSGRQLSDCLVATRPDMKVLFMSGYIDDTIVRHGIQDAEVNFLSKPFTPMALVQKVREILDKVEGQPALPSAGNASAPSQAACAS